MLVVTWRITAHQTIRDAEAGEGAAMAPTSP